MRYRFVIGTGMAMFILSISVLVIVLARNLLIPLVFSFFFTYMLYPLVWKLEQRGMHRIVAIFMVMLVALLALGALSLFLIIALSDFSFDPGLMKQTVDARFTEFLKGVEAGLGVNISTLDTFINRISNDLLSSWENKVGSFFTATTTTLFQIVMLPVYTFFFLFYRTKIAWFIFRLTGRLRRQRTLLILREVSRVTTRYLGGLLLVILILAVLNSLGLFVLGVPHALLFGVFAALLNLIPYVGSFMGGFIPVVYVFFTYDHPLETMIKVALLFSVVQFLESYLFTPNIVGSNVKINPLAIIVSLLLANMIWGIAGMMIVVPILAILKIIMRNINELKPFAFLISDRGVEKHRLRFNLKKRNKIN